jgi:hypothetical protein
VDFVLFESLAPKNMEGFLSQFGLVEGDGMEVCKSEKITTQADQNIFPVVHVVLPEAQRVEIVPDEPGCSLAGSISE